MEENLGIPGDSKLDRRQQWAWQQGSLTTNWAVWTGAETAEGGKQTSSTRHLLDPIPNTLCSAKGPPRCWSWSTRFARTGRESSVCLARRTGGFGGSKKWLTQIVRENCQEDGAGLFYNSGWREAKRPLAYTEQDSFRQAKIRKGVLPWQPSSRNRLPREVVNLVVKRFWNCHVPFPLSA